MKSFIYRYFGIYLARQDELDYLISDDFWNEFNRIKSSPQNDMSDLEIQRIVLGMWQCNAGYSRYYSRYIWSPNPLVKLFSWFHILYITIKNDLRHKWK